MAAHGELEENQGKNPNLVFNAFPENNNKISVEDGVPDEDGPKDAYSAPLHRKLKSRHLQMIAIGGKLICSQKMKLFFFF
jgi:amino acid permease